MSSKLQKNIQQYIELVYWEKSPLNTVVDPEERKKKACDKAKLDYNSEEMQAIMRMQNEEVNSKIFEFQTQQNPLEYILLNSDEHLFLEINRRLMLPLETSEDKETELKDLNLRSKMSAEADQLLLRINNRRKSIFGGLEEQESAAKQMRLIKPEHRVVQKSA